MRSSPAFTLVASIISALLFGTILAMRGLRRARAGGAGGGGDGRHGRGKRQSRRARSTLAAAELTFAVLLLAGALLMLNSFARLTLP